MSQNPQPYFLRIGRIGEDFHCPRVGRIDEMKGLTEMATATKDLENTTPTGDFDSMVSGAPGTDLAPVGSDEDVALQIAGRAYTATPTFTMDDISLPRLRLAQGLTPEVQDGNAKPGQWVLTGYEPADKVEFIPLLFTRARSLKDDDKNTMCQSADSFTGVGTPGGVCATCPMQEWTESAEGKRVPPPCQFSYSYVGWSVTHESPVAFEVKSTALTAGKFLNTQIRARGLGAFKVVLSANSQQSKRGSYYVPQVTLSHITEEELEAAKTVLG